MQFAVIGAGIAGSTAALSLADQGHYVDLFERQPQAMTRASYVNEGKIHLGYVYAADPMGQTYQTMLDGGFAFRPILERWIRASDFDPMVTECFDYIVPQDSQKTPDQIRSHFTKVDAAIAAREEAGQHYLGAGRLPRWQETARGGYSDDLCASFQTSERAVDTWAIADALRTALQAHPRIQLLCGQSVQRVERMTKGWQVLSQSGHGPYSGVLNAAWEGRRALDHASGFEDHGRWFTRYKCTMNAQLLEPAAPLHSFTAMLGPYGDLVRYNDGRIYLSWYPSAMAQGTDDLAPKDPELSTIFKRRLISDSLKALGAWHPALAKAEAEGALNEWGVAGGMIVARGISDIDDRQSQLHQRHEIGLWSPQPGFVSLDTGKYTVGPALGVAAAQVLMGQDLTRAAS